MRRNWVDRLRPLRRLTNWVEVAELRFAGHSVLSLVFRTPALVLESTGRRSGRLRRTAVAFHETGDGRLVISGGAGGQTRTPDWVANLRATAAAEVIVRRKRRAVTAIELTGADREALMPELRGRWPRIATYERRSGRPVPVFDLAAPAD